MSSTSRRTWHRHHVGYLHLTVEAEPTTADRNLARHRGLADVTHELLELFNSHRLPATWAVGEPGHSPLSALLTLSEDQHELALVGNDTWLGAEVGRTQFARELGRRVTQARAAGIELSTFVPRVATVTEHMDLVVRHGIRAIVDTQKVTARRYQTTVPHAVHYGVWAFSTTERLPLKPSFLGIGRRNLLHAIRRVAAEATTFHLVVDAPAVEQQGRSAVNSIAWLMRRVAQLRDRGLLRVETLGAAASRLSDLPTVKPQQSILRVAA